MGGQNHGSKDAVYNARRDGFRKGHQKFGSRKVGSVNHATKLLKEAILLAAEPEGSNGEGKGKLVGFLRKVCQGRPSCIRDVVRSSVAAAS